MPRPSSTIFIRAMTDESRTQDFSTTTVIEEEDVAAEDSIDVLSDKDSTPWHVFGTVCPKEEIMFLCQVIVLFTVILIRNLQPDDRSREF